jgi:hypothetical protein
MQKRLSRKRKAAEENENKDGQMNMQKLSERFEFGE